MIFTKSCNKVISLVLAIALVLTMFVTVAPTNVMATGASGEVGESGESGADPIRINIENLKLDWAQTSDYYTKKPYEVFVVGEALPSITTADFTVAGEGSENVTTTEVTISVWNGTEYVTATGTVEAGKWYKISCFYKANDGYELYYPELDDIDTASINFICYACVNSSNEIVAIDYSYNYRDKHLCPTYEAGVTIPTISNAGRKVIFVNDTSADYFPYDFSEGNVEFKELGEVVDNTQYWYPVRTTTFVAGKTYALAPVLEAVDGYTFNCDNKHGWINEDDTTEFQYIWNLGVCPAKTSNALNGQLATTPAVTSVTDLTDNEQQGVTDGATPKLDLTVKTATPPTADKTATEGIVSSEKLTVAQYLDIDLNLVMGDYTRALTELKVPVTVQITVPAQFRGVNREFSIIRVHDGVATKIAPKSYNQYTGVLTFETDKFSIYALAYKDTTPTTPTTPVYGGGVAIFGTTGHIHSYKYSYNKDGHWQNCSCGAATSEQKHSLNSSGVCVCGYDENSKTNTPVANPSTGASSLTFIFVVISVLALYGTTATYSSRKKHSK